MRTLVIHVVSTEDTKFLSRVYDGLDYDGMYNPTRNVVECMLKHGGYERVIMLGHGDSGGLYDNTLGDYLIHGGNAGLLEGKEVIGVWCYAAEFADRCELKGFFTSRFISNFSEAEMCGFHETVPQTIESENYKFAERLHYLLKDGIPLVEFPVRLCEDCNKDLPY